ncbi:ketosteroid isomerase-like protein [Allocatelliglobosispora scoriae]|uniref:Ketosteroid isomerase-like protein n=1 Tax=Allocatelliglobosispora scoriae TaxID=643052 RepID=A0A841BJU6_9ACTN|nr:nuclear transport factor 2 family protein [Allocatelliglobosispora scoriae]MBB5867439.1 ketosteroid isomerase-like protein [Allocatelliglobosispora scoriae]
MTEQMPAAVAAWHRVVESRDLAGLAPLLAPDVVFRSPAVHAPQNGPDITAAYLAAALAVLGPTIRYEREWYTPDGAVLEFHADLDGTAVHGVDMMRLDADGRIVEFTVMVRPLRGLNRLVEEMGKALAAQRPAA